MTKTNLHSGIILLLLLTPFWSCNLGSSSNTTEIVKIEGVRKFKPFNKVDETRAKLFKVGIGEISEWKENGNATVSSKTPYYEFGDPSPLNSDKNNLSYHLHSEGYHSISRLMLVLNINNPLQEDEAIRMFRTTVKRTFEELSTAEPEGLIAAIDSSKYYKSDNELFSTELKRESSLNDRLTLTVETK